ncbi:hypothetical protein D3C76_1396840 [compost metagenome]
MVPMMERIMKPGISAEKERDTDAGTLSGKRITQLRRIIKVNISATTRPITIPEMMFAPPSQLAPTAYASPTLYGVTVIKAATDNKPAASESTLRSSANAIPIKKGAISDIIPSVPLYTLPPMALKPFNVSIVEGSKRTPNE